MDQLNWNWVPFEAPYNPWAPNTEEEYPAVAESDANWAEDLHCRRSSSRQRIQLLTQKAREEEINLFLATN